MDDLELCGACRGHGTVKNVKGPTGQATTAWRSCDVCKGRGFIQSLQIKEMKPVGKASRF